MSNRPPPKNQPDIPRLTLLLPRQVHFWDELRSVDGAPVAELDDQSIVDLVRGPPGTTVTLGLVGGGADGKCGEERRVTLQRGLESTGAEIER